MNNICRSCKKPIHWAKTMKGLNIPVDANPEIDHLFDNREAVLFDPARMTAHFATCPNADKHRNKGRR